MTNVMSEKAEDSYQPYLEPLYAFPPIMSSPSSGSYIFFMFLNAIMLSVGKVTLEM